MVDQKDITRYVEDNIQVFHSRRLENLTSLKLQKVLKRKNPYLFKAKNINIAGDLVKNLLDAHLSSQEEGIFGTFLESLAIFICSRTYEGKKSPAEGIDLEFDKDGRKYIVSIKSGPNWGNSGQIRRMIDDFRKAKRILRTNSPTVNVVAINGCCYGRVDSPDKGDYLKLCGQRFWSFISGNENLFIDIIEPLGHKAKQKNDRFQKQYSSVINKFSFEFMKSFCDSNGKKLWQKVVQLNSGKGKNRIRK